MELTGKKAFVTGSSRGIGRAIAIELARRGAEVVVHASAPSAKAEETLSLIREAGGKASFIPSDLSHPENLPGLIKKAGGCDILVLNASMQIRKPWAEITADEYLTQMNCNFFASLSLIQQAVPYMKAKKWGRIINISSMWGQVGASCEVAYSAAKAGVIGFTKALAQEVAPSGITVNCVAPGAIDTEMNAHLPPEALEMLAEETPLGRLGRPEEVAQALVFLASEKAAFLTGQVIAPNGGLVM